MDSSLRELFGRAGSIRAVDRVASGSPASFVFRLPEGQRAARTIDGTLALARRGMPMLCAKPTMEALLLSSEAFVEVTQLDDLVVLTEDMQATGIVPS